jgi:hypothetical protein
MFRVVHCFGGLSGCSVFRLDSLGPISSTEQMPMPYALSAIDGACFGYAYLGPANEG